VPAIVTTPELCPDSRPDSATRLPTGHPEGYFEAFGQLYKDLAELLKARIEGHEPEPSALLLPTCEDGVKGMRFIEAAIQSSRDNAKWTPLAGA